MRAVDMRLARICAWLKKHRLTAHVDRYQRITLRDKVSGAIVYQENHAHDR